MESIFKKVAIFLCGALYVGMLCLSTALSNQAIASTLTKTTLTKKIEEDCAQRNCDNTWQNNPHVLNLTNQRIATIGKGFSDWSCYDVLTYLRIAENNIDCLPSKAFKPLINLKSLHLDCNSINKIHPNAFDGLVSLITLDLSSNSLRQVDKDMLSGLTLLERLSLQHNQLVTVSEDAFACLGNLKWLDLSENQFAYVPLSIIEKFKTLNELKISGGMFTCWSNQKIKDNPQLFLKLFPNKANRKQITERYFILQYLEGDGLTPDREENFFNKPMNCEDPYYKPERGYLFPQKKDNFATDLPKSCALFGQASGDLFSESREKESTYFQNTLLQNEETPHPATWFCTYVDKIVQGKSNQDNATQKAIRQSLWNLKTLWEQPLQSCRKRLSEAKDLEKETTAPERELREAQNDYEEKSWAFFENLFLNMMKYATEESKALQHQELANSWDDFTTCWEQKIQGLELLKKKEMPKIIRQLGWDPIEFADTDAKHGQKIDAFFNKLELDREIWAETCRQHLQDQNSTLSLIDNLPA